MKPHILILSSILTLAHSNLIIVTDGPIPQIPTPTFTDPTEQSSWSSSTHSIHQRLASSATSALSALHSHFPAPSIEAELSSLTASLTAFLPPEIAIGNMHFTTAAPKWWPALPDNVRSYEEQSMSIDLSIARAFVAEISKAEAKKAGTATLTPSGTGKPHVKGGAAGRGGGGLGAGVLVVGLGGLAWL